jgi:hypothetical protein
MHLTWRAERQEHTRELLHGARVDDRKLRTHLGWIVSGDYEPTITFL